MESAQDSSSSDWPKRHHVNNTALTRRRHDRRSSITIQSKSVSGIRKINSRYLKILFDQAARN
jgi:hypothetical protein